jgi:predicted O-linked N-acetylglucosamine transferase (SPINDLY family)
MLAQRHRFEEAAAEFQQAANIDPGHPDAQGNLGIVLTHLKRYDEAIWVLRQATARAPKNAEFHSALGACLYFKRQLEAALAACKDAITLSPQQGQAHHILSLVYRDMGRPIEHAASAKLAAQYLPGVSDAQVNYGESLRDAGKVDEAETHYRAALQNRPFSEDLHNNLGNVLKDQGRLNEALNEYRHAITIHPTPGHLSNLAYTMQYHSDYSPEQVFEELKRYDDLFAKPLAHILRPHANDRSPNRRLRIGYVSGEFRQHALGLNLMPLFTNHDKSQFEIMCYSTVTRADFYTFRIRQCADQWHDVHGLSDDDLAQQIRRDNIDILVELHQHIAGNRLPLYARKPAPVQIAFAGYPGTTGLSTIDFRLSDPFLDPPEGLAGWHQPSSEAVIRLPNSFWCYHPVIEIPVNPLPALINPFITFGNLNNFCKLNDPTYHLWARVLQAVPNSHLLLLAPEGSPRNNTRKTFERLGIAADRIRFSGRLPQADYCRLYHQIDVCLDSFPCNGHTTSLDSFYMGVPVITKQGRTLFGRATFSQLSNLGLNELCANDDDAFVNIATSLASDLPRLSALRQSLRSRMKASPLMDEPASTRGIEAAYRHAWHLWCASPAPI